MSEEISNRTIFRRAKDRANPYVMIDKSILENPDLSWKAKGLMAYLLSRPDDWVVWMTDLEKRSTDGRDAVASAVQELVAAGYMTRHRKPREHGRFTGTTVMVHEVPVSPEERTIGQPSPASVLSDVNIAPETGLPETVQPDTENPPYTYNDYTDNDVSIGIGKNAPTTHNIPESQPDGQPEYPDFFSAKDLEEIARNKKRREEEANLWRRPRGAREIEILEAVGRTRYDDPEEQAQVLEILQRVASGAIPEKYLKSRLWCARQHDWGLSRLVKSALSTKSLAAWQQKTGAKAPS